jgi:serine/threonine protein kinase/ActR/RegA family two-component response regulator
MSGKNHILLVNRDENFLESLCSEIQKSGYTVHKATDMRGALTAVSSHPVGLIVCDNALQDVTGYEFLHYLKSDPLRESISFIFFVPLNDQGSAFKAFQMGAVDFLVYPMEVDVFIKRIKEVILTSSSDELDAASHVPGKTPVPPTVKGAQPFLERRGNKRTRPLPHLPVEISRDGVVWLPGRVVNFNRGGIFVETALLGKQGLALNLRFSLPTGIAIVKGEIRHIALNDPQQEAAIGIKIEETEQWERIFLYMQSLMRSDTTDDNATQKSRSGVDPTKTVILGVGNPEEKFHSEKPAMAGLQEPGNESYDLRFYHSLIGKQLDAYKVVSFIGNGTMGGVFKGWDTSLERTVALKVISYKLASMEKFRDMFVGEARIISKLEHPNIAHIYYIGITNDILYYAMEFILGDTLKDLIKNRVNLNTVRGLDYLITICQALDFVSKEKIIHRDIKPANIMINHKGVLKIVDFGVAKIMDADAGGSKQEGIVGSPFYISPDCIEGRPLDHRCDIYSLGASFYHAFTGCLPFEGNTTQEVLLKHLSAQCLPLTDKNPKVPKLLDRIILKMMARNPDNRYQGYGEIINDLRSLRSKALKFQDLKNATLILKARRPTDRPPPAKSAGQGWRDLKLSKPGSFE